MKISYLTDDSFIIDENVLINVYRISKIEAKFTINGIQLKLWNQKGPITLVQKILLHE